MKYSRLLNKKKLIRIILFILLAYTISHIIIGAIYNPLFKFRNVVGNPSEQISTLKETIFEGKEFVFSTRRQYGPIFLLVMYPIIYFVKSDILLATILLFIDYIFIIGIFLLSYKLLFKNIKYGFTLLFILFFNFSPLYYTLVIRNVEIWEVFLLLLSLYYFLNNKNILAGISVALAANIKILPIIFIFYFLIKDRRVFYSSIITTLCIISISSLVIGLNAGFLYWPKIIEEVIKPNSFAAGFYENNSLKGFMIKILGGFSNYSDDLFIKISWEIIFVQIIWFLFALYGIYFIIKNIKKDLNIKDNTLAEYGFLISFILVFSPLTSFENTTLGLPAYIIATYFILKYQKDLQFKNILIIFILSYLLVGIFIPYSVMLKIIPFKIINNFFCNNYFTMHDSYKIYGFITIGIILIYLFFIRFIKRILILKKLKNKP